MSWSNKLLLLAMLALTSCGFEPVYSSRTGQGAQSVGQKIEGVVVESVTTAEPDQRRLAQLFRAKLEDRINPGNLTGHSSPYRLAVGLNVIESPIAISRDGTISRYNLNITADMTLSRASDGEPLYRGYARRTSSYNNSTSAFFSTYVSSEDAKKRAAEELAQDIGMRLAAFFAQNPNPKPIPKKPKVQEPPKAQRIAPERK